MRGRQQLAKSTSMEGHSNRERLDKLLDASRSFTSTVTTALGKLSPTTERENGAYQLLVVSLNHYRCINSLLEDDRFITSALALRRIVMDSSFRSVWISRFASDAKVSKALNSDKAMPPPKKVAKLLQEHWKQPNPVELEAIQTMWGRLSSYVHTGSSVLENLSRYHQQGPHREKVQIYIVRLSSLFLTNGAYLTASKFQGEPDIVRSIEKAFITLDTLAEELLAAVQQDIGQTTSPTIHEALAGNETPTLSPAAARKKIVAAMRTWWAAAAKEEGVALNHATEES